MNPGEIHLARFPFAGSVGAKLRPVLLLTGPLGSIPEVLSAYMTSIIPTALLPTDIVLDPKQPEHAGTNLKQVTIVRLHKLATIHDSDIIRQLGEVSSGTWSDVEAKLRHLLNLP
jgi:mRNA interferase MazF